MDFFNVIREGDSMKIREYIANIQDLTSIQDALLSDGSLVNVRDLSMKTALHYASGNGHLQLVQLLLNLGADVNAKCEGGWTALIQACGIGDVRISTELISNGADVNIESNMKWTALHYGAHCGDLHLVQLLLNAGAEVDAKNINKQTPLHWACSMGYLEVSKEFLTRGADMSIRNKDFETPLEICHESIKSDLQNFIRDELPMRRRSYLEEEQRSHALMSATSSQTNAEIRELRNQVETRTRERNVATATNVTLNNSLIEMTRERDTVTAERDTAVRGRDIVIAERNIAVRERDVAITERNMTVRERDTVTAERDAAVRERIAVIAERDMVVRERDTIMTERDMAVRERNAEIATNNALNTTLIDATRERDALRAERDVALRDREERIAQALEDLREGRRVQDCDDAFVRYRPYLHRPLQLPTGYIGVRWPLPDTSALHRLAVGLFRTRGSFDSRPVAGFSLVRVEAVISTDAKITSFVENMSTMRRVRETMPGYNADTALFTGPQMRVLNAIREEYHERSLERSRLEARTLYVFHGPPVAAVDGICENGLQAARVQDAGFFGVGSYSSLSIEYAARYAMGEFDGQPLQRDFTATGGLVPVIMFAAAVNLAYPVTPDVDYPIADAHSRFFGQPLSAGFDSHVACVRDGAGWEAVQREHCEYVELVVANYQQLLPLAVFWLRPL